MSQWIIPISNQTCNCASLAQVRKAGEGDSFRSWMLKCLIHSAQSSLVLLWEASPAVRNRPSLTYMKVFKWSIKKKTTEPRIRISVNLISRFHLPTLQTWIKVLSNVKSFIKTTVVSRISTNDLLQVHGLKCWTKQSPNGSHHIINFWWFWTFWFVRLQSVLALEVVIAFGARVQNCKGSILLWKKKLLKFKVVLRCCVLCEHLNSWRYICVYYYCLTLEKWKFHSSINVAL